MKSTDRGSWIPWMALMPPLLSLVLRAANARSWLWPDGAGLLLSAVISLVGAASLRFGAVHLRGEAKRGVFLRWGLVAVLSASVLVLSGHLLLLAAAWLSTSVAVDRLLRYHDTRPGAHRAADGKFKASRVGDVFLFSAFCIAWARTGSAWIPDIVLRLRPSDMVGQILAVLLAAAAIAKSAQVPLHRWLPRTLEAPTPVSALLHAGIVNAGAVLLLRFAPLLARSPAALCLLLLFGSASIWTGLSVASTRADVKGKLAWSTIAQMGFVLVELGLGAWTAALLHIAGHALYKSWSFLSSGGLPAPSGRNATPSGWLDASARVLATIGALSLGGRNLGIGDSILILTASVALATWSPGLRGWISWAGFCLGWHLLHAATGGMVSTAVSWTYVPPWAWPFLALPPLVLAGMAAIHLSSDQRNPTRFQRWLHLRMADGWSLTLTH